MLYGGVQTSVVRGGVGRGQHAAAHVALRAGGVGGRLARAHAGARAVGAAARARARQVGAGLHRGARQDAQDAAPEPRLLSALPVQTRPR